MYRLLSIDILKNGLSNVYGWINISLLIFEENYCRITAQQIMEQGSTRGTKQRYIAARTALSRTAPNNTNLLSSRRLWRASQRITLLVTGAAYSIELIRDFVTITLELATVGMVVMWIDPRPWSGCLSSVARSGECQHWSDIEVWWPNTWVSAQSVVAINVCCPWWLSQIWGLLVASPHPTGHLPLGSGRCSRLRDVITCGDLRVWMPPWKQCGLCPRFYGSTSQAIYTSGAH